MRFLTASELDCQVITQSGHYPEFVSLNDLDVLHQAVPPITHRAEQTLLKGISEFALQATQAHFQTTISLWIFIYTQN